MLTLCTLQCVPFSFGDPNKLAEIHYYAFMHFWMFRLSSFPFLCFVLHSSIVHTPYLSAFFLVALPFIV